MKSGAFSIFTHHDKTPRSDFHPDGYEHHGPEDGYWQVEDHR
jgi:hypothetical protein